MNGLFGQVSIEKGAPRVSFHSSDSRDYSTRKPKVNMACPDAMVTY